MRLVYKDTQAPVNVGDKVTLRDGGVYTVTGSQKPKHGGSTGRVYVKLDGDTYPMEYYPSVIGAEWIEREDR